ncbi:TonB-dependent siderophore receptor [Glaciecola sp. KUL10]|uniref:TonB-dependent receptor plug domain-containing protein n=1 Tax=Glaciecola sp. (strain KUL10) TaxID=2161813 RepID=UPI000D785F23|nr:TonB-dependent receptor [Glaciecola sp. KUL10]GBL05168.1 TonB-dependent outer membrane receptor [Glaciecola sp. KUL10]
MIANQSKLAVSVRKIIAATATAGVMVSAPALAQDSQSQNADASVEKIAVVGSRVAPRSIGDSAVPVDIISADEFKSQGSTDITTMMQAAVPSFNVNDQPINDASTLVRPANLRGLAPDHTLILVNGKRRHRSAVITFLGGQISDGAQGPDISTIPSIALKQVEVLRDGAAAQYGSDAIAGVINFALKDDSEGGSLEFNTGQYFEGDGDATQIAGNIGLPFTERGFANFSVEYRESDPTSRSVQRDDAAALIAAGNTFVADPAQVWGSPEIKSDLKFFANLGLELSDSSEAYLFGNFAKREVEGGFYFRNPHNRGGVNDGGTNDAGEQLLLVGDLTGDMSGNCPTDIAVGANVLTNQRYLDEVANNPDCFAFNELLPGGFTPKFGGIVTDASLAVGTKGELDNGMTYDVSSYYGSNEIEYAISNTINPSLGPDTPRDFKPGTYIQEEASFNIDLSQEISVDFAESLYVSGGFEYRYESFEAIAGDPQSYEVGPLASQGFGIGSNGFPGLAARFQGKNSRNSMGLYLDSEAYITDDFMIGAAIRYEDFTDFGNTTKGKISARYQMSDTLAVRGAIATGFKAPTIGQSNVRNVTTAFSPAGLVDRATLPPSDPIAIQKGATPLQPEESTSYSFGIVGEFDNGLFVTVDYFNIEVEDRISTTSGIQLTDADITALLAQGVTDASSFSEVSFFTNDFATSTQGIDVVANYSAEMLGGETLFSLAANWTDTEVDDVKTFNVGGEQVQNISATRIRMIEDNLPEYRYSLTANHTNGDLRALVRLNYFGEVFEDHIDAGLPIEEVSAEYTVDVELGYNVTEALTLTVGARNAFDNTPDENTLYDTEVAGSQYPTTSPIGINGGFYYLKGVYTF